MAYGLSEHSRFMELALELARKAERNGDSPVGAVVVVDGTVVGAGYNRMEVDRDPTAHAEMIALRQAGGKVGDWRLPKAAVYVTLEPCIMCAAALVHARVRQVVFGTHDERWGGLGSLFDLSHDPRLNHEMEVVPGVMKEEAARLLRIFFARVRSGTRRS